MRDLRERQRRLSGSVWRLLWLGIAAAVLLAGCSSVPGDTALRQRLDDGTGATVTTLETPLVFYREQPMLAANARDYIYLGPVEVNRNGRRQYLLWMAYRSTIDRAGGVGFRAPVHAYLLLDGEPMEMAPPETRALRGTDKGEWLYETPVGGGESVLYPVTRAQLLAIAKARDVRILTAADEAAATEYAPWRASASDFIDFSRYLNGDPINRLALTNE
jgi:hypothetical protein